MKTVILAGGEGKRAQPLSLAKPKPLFKILGKPLIQHVIETLVEVDLKDLIVVTGYQSEKVMKFLGDGSKFGVKIEFTMQKKQLGMANAVESARELLNESFVVVNADDIFDPELLKEMVFRFKTNPKGILLGAKEVKETWKYGILKMDKKGNVKKIVEKPEPGKEPSNMAVVGTYILPIEIFDYYKKVNVSDSQFEDAIQKYIEDNQPVRAVKYEGFFSSFKYPWDLFRISQHLMEKHLTGTKIAADAGIDESATIEGNVWIESGARVFAGATVSGPCYIGKNSLIGTNALVRNGAVVGDDCIVGFGSEVKNSIIGDNCWLHTNYVGDSIIGDNCKFGAGAVTANFRFDGENVKILIDEKKVDTGSDKFGAIVADNSMAGVNSSILPGMRMGPNSIVGPGVCLAHDLEPNKIILIDNKSYVTKDNKIK